MELVQCNLVEYACICSVVENVASVLLFLFLNAGAKKRLKEIMDLSLLKKSRRKKIKLSKADAREKCEKLKPKGVILFLPFSTRWSLQM